MKKKTIITIILTICSIIFLEAQSPLERRIDFAVEKTSISKALRQLSLESKVNIAYSSDFFNRRDRISLNVKNETIDNILARILQNSPVTYALVNQQVVVTSTEPKEKRKFTISGYIEAENSGERLIGVTIYNPKTNEGTTTNEYGFYSITLEEGNTSLSYRYIGCEEIQAQFDLTKNMDKNVVLQPSLTLSEVVILGNPTVESAEVLQDDHRESLENLRGMPMLGRGDDLVKQIRFLPGVEAGVDGLGGMFVRGGNIDQNLTMMDGVNIYNPSHLLGLFSVYNVNAVKSVRLYKGDFPARYGGRISSVLDVRTKDGNTKKYSGEISPGILSSRVTFEGPILKDKMAFFATSRFSHVNSLINGIASFTGEGEESSLRFNFYDANFKLHYSLSSKDKIFLSAYSGQDMFNFQDAFGGRSVIFDTGSGNITRTILDSLFQRSEVFWGNSIFSLRWNRVINPKLFSNATLTFSRFNFDFGDVTFNQLIENDTVTNFNYNFIEYENQNFDVGAKLDFEYIKNTNHYLRFGTEFTFHNFESGNGDYFFQYNSDEIPEVRPTLRQLRRENGIENEYSAVSINAYVEDEIKVNQDLSLNLGVRFSVFGNDADNWFGYVEPRIYAKYLLPNNWSLAGSITRTSQNVHLLTNTGLGLPIDVWIPSVEDIQPQTAWQETFGIEYHLRNNFKFKVEGFYKKMQNLVFLKSTIFQFESLTFSDSTFVQGNGISKGVEVTLEKEWKKVFAFGYYTLSKSDRQFNGFNWNRRFPFQYDRRHSLKLGFNWRAKKKLNIGATWTWSSGAPRIYAALFEGITEDFPAFNYFPEGEFNSVRAPAYHRLDIKFGWIFRKSYGTHHLGFSLYNAYFRSNVTYYDRFTEFDQNGNPISTRDEPTSITPVGIPSLNYSFRF
ncbi:MAG: TonB-dependent receptor [Bacteroidota bacterium]